MAKNKTPVNPPSDRPLGRALAAPATWDAIVAKAPVMPRIFRGETPRKSPGNNRFMPMDAWHQIRGFCVGYGRARQVQYLTRVPKDAGPGSKPRDGHRLSPLHAYSLARKYARDHGVNLGGNGPSDDGAIVSHSLFSCVGYKDAKGVNVGGFVPYKSLPADPETERKWPNNRLPDRDDIEEGLTHLVLAHALADSWEAILQGIAGGFVCNIGTRVTTGIMECDAEGRINFGGGNVGGHSWLFVDYDMDADEAIMGNSWPQWGWRDSAAAGGYSNMARVSLTDLRKEFTASKMRSGHSEATFVNLVAGFDPVVMKFEDTLEIPKD